MINGKFIHFYNNYIISYTKYDFLSRNYLINMRHFLPLNPWNYGIVKYSKWLIKKLIIYAVIIFLSIL